MPCVIPDPCTSSQSSSHLNLLPPWFLPYSFLLQYHTGLIPRVSSSTFPWLYLLLCQPTQYQLTVPVFEKMSLALLDIVRSQASAVPKHSTSLLSHLPGLSRLGSVCPSSSTLSSLRQAPVLGRYSINSFGRKGGTLPTSPSGKLRLEFTVVFSAHFKAVWEFQLRKMFNKLFFLRSSLVMRTLSKKLKHDPYLYPSQLHLDSSCPVHSGYQGPLKPFPCGVIFDRG